MPGQSRVLTGGGNVGGTGTTVKRRTENLSSQVDGVTSTLVTAVKFTHDPSGDSIAVYKNRGRLVFGAGADYIVSESGGVGTGYDTIELATVPTDAPRADRFVVHYPEA